MFLTTRTAFVFLKIVKSFSICVFQSTLHMYESIWFSRTDHSVFTYASYQLLLHLNEKSLIEITTYLVT